MPPMPQPFLISSLGSADSHSLSTPPAFAPPALLNSTPPNGSFSNPILPDPSSATLINSIAENFSVRTDALMSLREAFLARLSACLEPGWELPTHVGNGPRPSAWCANYDPVSQCLKTRQPSLLLNLDGPSMESSVKWPRSGMMVGGMLFQPLPLEPVIGENDSASYLPTPWASANESRQTKLTPSQEAGTHGQSLQAKIISEFFLPTPTVAKIGNDLTVLDATDQRERANKLGQAIGRKFSPEHFLPTPTATPNKESIENYQRRKDDPNSTRPSKTTAMALKTHFLPTPTTRDYKDTPGMAAEAQSGRLRDDQMPRRVYQTFAAESPDPTGGLKLSPEFLASLPKSRMTPAFLCWLQGYPENWLKPLQSALAIVSSPRRGSPSPRPSTKS